MTDIGFGREIISQDQALNSGSVTVDLDVPAGKAVISSGISADGFSNAYMSANGPHPTDDNKWRFMASNTLQNGGTGYSMTVHFWMIVVNAAS